MNHLEVWVAEQGGPAMREWLRWVAAAEKVCGDLDGDDLTTGRSLDTASDFYDLGIAPIAAAEIFLLRAQQVGAT